MKIPSMDKLKYLLRSAISTSQKGVCPYCHQSDYDLIARKYVVTRLVKCRHCQLLFRLPNDKPEFNQAFYQEDYVQDDHITTQLPSDPELSVLLKSNFKGTGKEVNLLLLLFQTLFQNLQVVKLLDFGASWGYMSFQFKQAGMDVQGYEISKKRAQFGREGLGVDIQHEKRFLRENNQIFFSSHVIEHVPSIREMIDDAKRLTSKTGPSYFIALSPNGSFARKEIDPASYHAHWGLVHPNLLSDQFYKSVFAAYPYFISSNPYSLDAIKAWDQKSQANGNLTGGELMIIVRLN